MHTSLLPASHIYYICARACNACLHPCTSHTEHTLIQSSAPTHIHTLATVAKSSLRKLLSHLVPTFQAVLKIKTPECFIWVLTQPNSQGTLNCFSRIKPGEWTGWPCRGHILCHSPYNDPHNDLQTKQLSH